jgi:Domain of unknown function (DUF1995)
MRCSLGSIDRRFRGWSILLPLILQVVCCYLPNAVHSLLTVPAVTRRAGPTDEHDHRRFRLQASSATLFPTGLSLFEKSTSMPGTFRKLAANAIDKAVRNGERLLEVDIPPFVGDKSQFDDYDNVSELDTNRDFCAQLLPLLNNRAANQCTWLVLPDDKECELAAINWTGQLYRSDTKRFTSIRAAYAAVSAAAANSANSSSSNNKKSSSTFSFKKAWGSTMAEMVNKLQGGDGVLADSTKLDSLTPVVEGRFQLICQPGNGGPVEDWINVEQLAQKNQGADTTTTTVTCVVNGALDKVRDGYYPALFFPALAKTIPFYKQFTPVLIAKPINDKGFAGWLFRVYPEPWQVILQTAKRPSSSSDNTRKNGGGSQSLLQVENTVVLQSDERPSYAQVYNALVTEGMRRT